jgi:hypothetical protein
MFLGDHEAWSFDAQVASSSPSLVPPTLATTLACPPVNLAPTMGARRAVYILLHVSLTWMAPISAHSSSNLASTSAWPVGVPARLGLWLEGREIKHIAWHDMYVLSLYNSFTRD